MSLGIVPVSVFGENLFRCVKTEDAEGRTPSDPNFNPYLELFDFQRDILDFMFTPNERGDLPFRTYIYSCPKKGGKTALNSLVCAWFGFALLPALGMPDEIIMAANSKEHSAGRVFQGVRYAILHEPLLRGECNERDIGQWKIKTKAGIEFKAIASDAGTAAGANFSLVSFDELWAMTTEGDRMLYEELTPVPTKRNSCRFISTYAGIPGESEELEELYHKAVDKLESEFGQGERVHPNLPLYVNREASICAYWDHEARLPWHTPEYLAQQRATLRPHAYKRLWENRWTAGEDGIDPLDWNACVRRGNELGWTKETAWKPDKRIRLAVGIDASMKKDRSAVVTCFKRKVMDKVLQPDGSYADKSVDKIFLGPRMYWQPNDENPMDYEESIEKFILELQKNYMLEFVYYDPYQFHRSAMTLWKKGVRMEEYTQTIPHGIEMCNHFLDLLRLGNLIMYEDEELRKESYAVSLKEVPGRGYRITKDTASKKIDSIVAFAMAALAAEQVPSSDEDFSDSIFILR